MTNQEWSESKEKIHFLFILRSTEERTRNEAIRNNSRQIRNWSRTKGRDMVGSSFMHSVPMHKFFQLRERINFFPCFFPPFCSFFLYSFIYLFFFFLFFFASILHHPPFFSATPLKATQYLTRVKMTYIWSSVFFFFLPSETFHSETWIDHQDREPGMEFQIKKPFAYAINCFPLVSTWITKHIHARFFFNVCAAKPTTQPV